MTETCFCPRCNVTLNTDAPAGLCPGCLIQMALEGAIEDTDRFSETEFAIVDNPVADISIPEILRYFGDYELLQRIARGGMGVIYKARQICLNRIVAVKMMLPGLLVSEAEASRFQNEAEVIANLRHPNIVAVHEVGAHDGHLYFSMDYVEGQSLAELVREHPLPARKASRYVKIIAEAIHYAHQQGILHRDLKPSNVLLDKTGNPRITDFGLAKRLASDSRLTATGAVLGTPSYMPPEQADGKRRRLAPASDVYSLGAILYELVTGRPPFQAATPLDTVLLVINTEPIAPRMLNPKLSRDLETICLKCLEKDPRWRYQSAQELADDLDHYLKREPIKARHIGVLNRGWRWCRRNPWQTIAATAMALVTLMASLWAIAAHRMTAPSEQRLWSSLIEQVRPERLTGNRMESLAAAEASRIRIAPELRQEAIQTITSSGTRLSHEIEGYNAVFSPDGKRMATYGGHVNTTIWDFDQRRTLRRFENSQDTETVCFSHDSRLIFSADFSESDETGAIKVYEVETGRILGAWTGHQGRVLSFSVSPDGRLLASGGNDRTIRLWEIPTGRELASWEAHRRGVTALAFSPDGHTLASSGSDGVLTLWNLPFIHRELSAVGLDW